MTSPGDDPLWWAKDGKVSALWPDGTTFEFDDLTKDVHPMKTYRGERLAGDRPCVKCDGQELPVRRDLVDHSMDLDWGTDAADGSRAQLAVAILADHMCTVSTDPEDCVEEALRLHQQFKVACVQTLPHDRWIITSDTVRNHLLRIRGQV